MLSQPICDSGQVAEAIRRLAGGVRQILGMRFTTGHKAGGNADVWHKAGLGRTVAIGNSFPGNSCTNRFTLRNYPTIHLLIKESNPRLEIASCRSG